MPEIERLPHEIVAPLIEKLVYQYWRRMPETHKRYQDIDDLRNSALVHFYKQTVPTFSDQRSTKFSTWTHLTVENFLRSQIAKTQTGSRRGNLVSMSAEPFQDDGPELGDMIPDQNAEQLVEIREVTSAVSEVCRRLSDEARLTLSECFFYSRPNFFPSRDAMEEIRTVCRSLGVTPNQLRLLHKTGIQIKIDLEPIEVIEHRFREMCKSISQPAILALRVSRLLTRRATVQKLDPALIREVDEACRANKLQKVHLAMIAKLGATV